MHDSLSGYTVHWNWLHHHFQKNMHAMYLEFCHHYLLKNIREGVTFLKQKSTQKFFGFCHSLRFRVRKETGFDSGI